MGMPTSCKDLHLLGHRLNGFYSVSVLLNGKTIGEAVSSDTTEFGGFSFQAIRKLNATDKVEIFMHFGSLYSMYFNGWILNEDLVI